MKSTRFKDKDIVLTKDDLFFYVIGYSHPPARILSYLKYVPSRYGKWIKRKRRFARAMRYYNIPSLIETIKFLEENYPCYLFNSKVLDIRMSSVPISYVKRHLIPDEGLRRLIEAEKRTPIEDKAVELASFLSDESGISLDRFGIAGSILAGLTMPFSDIDLVVYGKQNYEAVKETVRSLFRESSLIEPLKEEKLRLWAKEVSDFHPLTEKEVAVIYKRKLNRGVFRGTEFSIHPIKLDEEIDERYGDEVCFPKGIVSLKAEILDRSRGTFYPSIYEIGDVEMLEGSKLPDIKRLLCHELLYCDLFEEGDRILVRGKLEEVLDKKKDEKYHQVVIASLEVMGKDFVKILGTKT